MYSSVGSPRDVLHTLGGPAPLLQAPQEVLGVL